MEDGNTNEHSHSTNAEVSGDVDATTQTELKKKNSKKGLISGILVSVLLIGGTAAWFLSKPTDTSDQNTAVQTEKSKKITTLTKDTLFFKLGTKLIAYDPILKVEQVLTDEITHVDSRVLDFYSNYQNEWRAYVAVYTDDQQKIFLYSQDGLESELEVTNNSSIGPANAQHRLFTYDELPGFEESDKKTTRTFVVQGTQDPKLIRESEPQPEDGLSSEDLNDAHFFSAAISPDGKNILFQQANCFNCDGGYNARSFEINLDSNKTNVVISDENIGNKVHYDENGSIVVTNSNLGGLGEVSKVDISQFTDVNKDGNFVETARVQNDLWRLISANQKYRFIAAEKADDSSVEFAATMFDGFYRLGEEIGQYEKVTIANTPQNVSVSEIGENPPESENNCFGIAFADRNSEAANDTYRIGFICVESDVSLTYMEISSESLKPVGNFFYVEPVRVLN